MCLVLKELPGWAHRNTIRELLSCSGSSGGRLYLFQSFPHNSFCFSLVVRLHSVFKVIENLGVFVVAHALTDAVTGGLGASMQHSWGRGT